MRELEAEQRQITSEMDTLRDKARVLQQEGRKLRDDIDALDTQQGQQLNFMRKNFADQAAAWDWIQAHQNEFQKEVFGPPMISCSVKDERYSNQIQSLLQMDDFLCFTTQTKEDHRKLTNQLYGEMSLSVVIRTCLQPRQAFKPPVEHVEAVDLGLDGFAIDYLEGPDPVLAMLCAEKRLHQSGVAVVDHDDAAYDKLINHGKINQWATAKQSFTVRRRKEYGPQAMTTLTKNIHPGRFWTSQPIDAQEKTEMTRKLAESKGERDMLKEQHQGLQTKYNEIDDTKTTTSQEIVCCFTSCSPLSGYRCSR